MSQIKELESIKRKIKALMETSGFTEVELTNRMAKVGELLNQYNLTMGDIQDMRDQAFLQSYVCFGQQKRTKTTTIMSGIAIFTNTKCWSSTSADGIKYFFFGMESDVDAAKYLLEICHKTMLAETKTYTSKMITSARGQKRVAQTNFQEAFATRIYYRLKKMKEDYDAELAAARQTGTSLMVVKNELVEAEWAKEGVKLRSIKYYHTRGYNASARAAGTAAGDRMNLNRPLGNSSQGANKLMVK